MQLRAKESQQTPKRIDSASHPPEVRMLNLILLVFAFVCLMLAAFNVPAPPRFNLGWLGMAFWCLSLILGDARFR
jgi:hypothetical protein